MTLQDLIRRFRVLAKDTAQPYRAQDDDVRDWLNDAQEEACVRGRLLREDVDPAICRIPLQVGQHTYKLHTAAYELIDVRRQPAGGGEARKLDVVSREWLDAEMPSWRTFEGEPRWLVQDDISVRVVGRVTAGDILSIECYRLPLEAMAAATDEPEIHSAHHVHLIQWALHKAFSIPDSELFDPNRSALSEQEFSAYFGVRPDSDLRRATRHDTYHHIAGYLA